MSVFNWFVYICATVTKLSFIYVYKDNKQCFINNIIMYFFCLLRLLDIHLSFCLSIQNTLKLNWFSVYLFKKYIKNNPIFVYLTGILYNSAVA